MILRRERMTNSVRTQQLLRRITRRLSGREDCKKVNYRVTISDNGIYMEPLILVYRDRYHRKEQDKMSIITYVHDFKMSNIRLDEFVFGSYEYQLSADGKNRRWRRLD